MKTNYFLLLFFVLGFLWAIPSCQTLGNPQGTQQLATDVVELQAAITHAAEKEEIERLNSEILLLREDLESAASQQEIDIIQSQIDNNETQVDFLESEIEQGLLDPSLIMQLTSTLSSIAENEAEPDSSLPEDIESWGLLIALGLGAYNQAFGSRRSARLEKESNNGSSTSVN